MKPRIYIYDTLGFFDAARLVVRRPGCQAYYRTISGHAKFLLRSLKRISGHNTLAQQLEFRLSELKRSDGGNPYLDIVEHEVNDILKKIGKLNSHKNNFAASLMPMVAGTNKFSTYSLKKIFSSVRDTVLFINVLAMTFKNSISQNKCEIEYIIDNTYYLGILKEYAATKQIQLSGAGFRNAAQESLRIYQCIFLNPLYALLHLAATSFCGNVAREKTHLPRVGVFYSGREVTLDETSKNEFFWLLRSNISLSRVLVYFFYNDSFINDATIDQLAKCGIESRVLFKAHRRLKSSPRWHPGGEHLKNILKFNGFCLGALMRTLFNSKQKSFKYLADIFEFYQSYAYWHDFFKTSGIKININPIFSDPTSIPMHLALERLGGLSVSYQLTDFEVSNLSYSVFTDTFFSFGPYYLRKWANAGSYFKTLVYCGYVTDYAFSTVKEKAAALRQQLTRHGAEFVIAYFDEHSSDNRMDIIQNASSASIYGALFEALLRDPTMGLICKPKKPKTLHRRLAKIKALMGQALHTGRLRFLSDGMYVTRAYPAEAALASDLTVGSLIGGTTVLESYLAGVPSLYLNLEQVRDIDKYPIGKGIFIFDSVEALMDAITSIRLKRAMPEYYSRFEEALQDKLMFRDGQAAIRIGEYIYHVLESFDRDDSAHLARENADSEYRKRWGEDSLVNLKGEYAYA